MIKIEFKNPPKPQVSTKGSKTQHGIKVEI